MSVEKNEAKIEQLEYEIKSLKESLKELQSNNKEECSIINNRIKELEERHSKMELFAIEMKQDVKFYSTKVLEIDGVLKEIAKEIKTISTKLVELEVVRKMAESKPSEEGTAKFLDKLMDSNNRAFLYLIITLCSIALMSFGAKISDITKILIP